MREASIIKRGAQEKGVLMDIEVTEWRKLY
jgi:hypothetical protein